MSELVRFEDHERIAEIVLNRPEKRNAINLPLLEALERAIDAAENTSGVRAVLVRGEGRGFSAGIDLLGFEDLTRVFGPGWRDNMFPVTAAFQRVLNKVAHCSLPTIALVHGFALGLGFELALACDFRIVTRDAKLGLPEARLGLIPDAGGTTRLTQLVGPARAKELIMTGRNLDLQAAERWGAVSYVVSGEELLEKGRALAAEIMQAAPLAVRYAKRIIDGLADADRGLQLEAWAQSILARTKDFEAGSQAMLLQQPVEWEGR